MAEPVTLAEAKAQCRVLHSEEDGLLTALISAAREWVENNTGHVLVQREKTELLAGVATVYRPIYLPLASEIVAVEQSDGQVLLTYTAGYDEGEVPASLKQAMLMLIGHWYANRQAATTETVAEVPIAVESLCGQFRRPGV